MRVFLWVFGLSMMVMGAPTAFRPKQFAEWNDSKGPKWLREFSTTGPKPAYPGRTSPGYLRFCGVLLFGMGALVVYLGFAVEL